MVLPSHSVFVFVLFFKRTFVLNQRFILLLAVLQNKFKKVRFANYSINILGALLNIFGF